MGRCDPAIFNGNLSILKSLRRNCGIYCRFFLFALWEADCSQVAQGPAQVRLHPMAITWLAVGRHSSGRPQNSYNRTSPSADME